MTKVLENQINWFEELNIPPGSGPDGQSMKTSREPIAPTGAETLPQYWKRVLGSSSRKHPIFLYLKKDGLHAEWSTGMDGRLLGQLTTLSTMAAHSGENGYLWSATTGDYLPVKSSLSAILEQNLGSNSRYNLSAKACQGILSRAERRGKELPEELKQALLRQAGVE